MNAHAAITGVGLITALGSSAEKTWEALLRGQAISDHARIPDIDSPHRAAAIAEIAGREALAQSRWSAPEISSPSTALIIATSKGPIETWLANDPKKALHPSGIAQIAAATAARFGFLHGPRLTLCAACASGLHGLIRAAMMIQSGQIHRALVIATETSLHPLFLGSFARLGVLPPAGFGCRPFDRDRAGFLLSEAAAAVCIESPPQASATAIAHIEAAALGGDATHLTGNDPAAKTLKYLLARVIQNRTFDFIHAHGTGTIQNDPPELNAIESQLQSHPPPVPLYSHKAALGHSLGASGLVSIVLNCLAHQRGTIPGNIRTTHPLATSRVLIDSLPREFPIRRSLAIAAGFGGAIAVVSLKSP